uniref:Large ribosomal subunit protein mL42 n=1 Tax=Poecilia mexicana TaxID=48701 RepID=A0A3B3XG96_9TELE
LVGSIEEPLIGLLSRNYYFDAHSIITEHGVGSLVQAAQRCISTFIRCYASKCAYEVEIGVTSDGKTIVCYHPAVDVPYELTQPIERPDPLTNQAETHDQVLKAHLSKEVLVGKEGPTIEELSKMFFTTKHRFYPKGQYVSRRINKKPPKDR